MYQYTVVQFQSEDFPKGNLKQVPNEKCLQIPRSDDISPVVRNFADALSFVLCKTLHHLLDKIQKTFCLLSILYNFSGL